ncbi:hypothetical protein MKW94_013115 [Papaver nudicaule]|uniref:Uncharacterized protein n=1 Tax=Papaver nudicaule TaxID=74823 RepID=A0AA41SDV5_PAPNU|nr:hypothetical protein [Papaver nudicaule]
MSSSSSMTPAGAHILIFPYPAQGHMLPILDFAHQLSLHDFTITIVVTPKNLPSLNPLLTKSPSIKTLVLPFPGHPSIPQGIENAQDLSPELIPTMMLTMTKLHDPLLRWFKSHPSPPVAIISDFFLGWTYHLACELNIPRIVFSTSCAMSLSIIDLLHTGIPNIKDDPICFHQVPNSPTFPRWHVPSVDLFTEKKTEVVPHIHANVDSWGVVFNSFTELNITEFGQSDLLFLMGKKLNSLRREAGQVQSTEKILSWLDSCPDDSVVYICFGSQAALPNNQMEALAAGLECSKVRFLWCVKEPGEGLVKGEYGVLPAGFEERTAGRGMVVRGWVPQLLILRHRSVGSFMTHCGWNSIVEGLTSGVVMLAWPMMAEQFFNVKLIVDQLKVAIRVCEGNELVPNSVQLGELVVESMSEERRLQAKKLSEAANEAVKQGGTSHKDLQSLVKDLRGLINEREVKKETPLIFRILQQLL